MLVPLFIFEYNSNCPWFLPCNRDDQLIRAGLNRNVYKTQFSIVRLFFLIALLLCSYLEPKTLRTTEARMSISQRKNALHAWGKNTWSTRALQEQRHIDNLSFRLYNVMNVCWKIVSNYDLPVKSAQCISSITNVAPFSNIPYIAASLVSRKFKFHDLHKSLKAIIGKRFCYPFAP